MELNIKYLLSGLSPEEINHPTVERIVEYVRENGSERLNQWVEELIEKNN